MVTPHYADDWLTVYGGDVREVLPELASDSVDCIVTSPPYWGLRDYGTATWIGGDEGCDHGRGFWAGSTALQMAAAMSRPRCKCGATRQDSQLGLEATPEEYVANLVGVFRELRRVLKPSGTCWLNLGDSYARDPGKGQKFEGGTFIGSDMNGARTDVRTEVPTGLKPKDLVGIPWRVAFALQADGWYLRSDIIWAKPNPMPESVTDRPTKAHEYLFLLSKSPRYYFDQEAVREQEKPWNGGRINAPKLGPERMNGAGAAGTTSKTFDLIKGANLRSVWTIATRPYPGAHFAVFPPELPERCIKAGSSERGVCPECGAPWERVVERTTHFEGGSGKAGRTAAEVNANGKWAGKQYGENIKLGPVVESLTTGWRPTCPHSNERVQIAPAVILDPFAGSGTVGLVANRLSRRAILIDLNPAYLEQQMQRNAQVPVGL